MSHTSSEPLIVPAAVLLLLLPAIPISMGWLKVNRLRSTSNQVRRSAVVVLTLVTCSQVILSLGLLASDVIGPDYSTRRFVTIFVNLGITVTGTVVAAVAGGGLRALLVTSCAWVSASWFYAAIVSSVA